MTKDRIAPFGLNIRQAMLELGITRELINRAITEGDIKTVRFAGRHYIPQNEIDRLQREYGFGPKGKDQ